MRSFTALALGLALASPSSARVTNAEVGQVSTSDSGSVVVNWLGRLFRRKAQVTCFEDEYYEFVSQPMFGEQFCQDFMAYPVVTATVETTPVTTTTEVYSTVIVTKQEVEHTTVVTTASTVTITPTPVARRNAALDVNELFNGFRREKEALNSTIIDTPQMSSSFSSACNCQTYGGPTVTATQTNSAKVATVRAFERNTTTIVSVQTDAVITTTATVTASATPTPIAPAFSCPDDNNSTVSQLIGNERFDYLVLCNTDLGDLDFYNVLSYSSFSECAAACSIADARFDSPVCQGFSYYATNSAYNCFLKGTANQTVPAVGVDSAILQRIAVGLTDDMPAGTNTESAPWAGKTQTMDPSQLSSSMSVIIANSSTSIPVITPGPDLGAISGRPVAPGETSYSTYISDGSTYSSGTVFSSYYSANGSWYYTYYTAYIQSWASETTVYAATETGTSISNSSDTTTSTQAGNNGEYYTITVTNTTSYFPSGYNVTEVTSNVTSASNGTQIASSAVTSYYSIATGGAGGGSGGSGSGGSGSGAIGSSGAGNITGAGVTSTSVFSTFSVFSNGVQTGGLDGGAGSGVVQTPAPSVIVTSGGTAFSSGFAASGVVSGGSKVAPSIISTAVVVGGTAFSSGFAASGVVSGGLEAVPSIVSTAVVTGGTAFSSGFAASGGGEGAESVDSTAASGAITPSPGTGIPFIPISSTNAAGGTAFSSGFAASGVVSDEAVASSTALSGVVVTTTTTPLIPIFSTRSASGANGASSTAASGSSPFTNSNGNRSGTLSTTSTRSSRTSPTTSSPSSSLSSTPSSAPSSAPSVPPSSIRSVSSSSSPSSSPSSSSRLSPSSSPLSSSPVSSRSGVLSTGSVKESTSPSTSLAGSPSTQSSARPTGPVPYFYVPFTNSNGLRTYIAPGSSVPSGYVTASELLSSGLFSTGFVLTGTAPTSTLTRPGVMQTIPSPTGGAPPSGFPSSTGLIPSGSAPSGTRPLSSTVTASSGFPFSNSELPRTGTLGLSSRTSPTSASPYPTGASSCVTSYLGKTTMFTTVTEYGCYSNCPAQASALTFGPPTVPTGGPGGYY